jgi:hypothetical protein
LDHPGVLEEGEELGRGLEVGIAETEFTIVVAAEAEGIAIGWRGLEDGKKEGGGRMKRRWVAEEGMGRRWVLPRSSSP